MGKKEHLTPEFKAINPAATVPTLADGNVRICDSNAIAIYLVEKYAKDDSLYPKDLVTRALINERLFFFASFIFPRLYQAFFPVCFEKEKKVLGQKLTNEILRGYETIESYLNGNEFLAGSTLTLCDISGWNIMEPADRLVPVDGGKFPKLIKWLAKMREHSDYPMVKDGADAHFSYYEQCLLSNL